jgi:hypothetical protein
MRAFHNFISPKPPTADPTLVSSQNWNDVQPAGVCPAAYTASGIVPTQVDYIRATGGANGIALQLTPGIFQAQGPNGTVGIYQTYFAMKVDAGAGVVTFSDVNGALINGGATYTLENQFQWAIFMWNGTSWDVFGN